MLVFEFIYEKQNRTLGLNLEIKNSSHSLMKSKGVKI